MTNHKHGQVYFQQSSIFYKEQSTLLKKIRSQWGKSHPGYLYSYGLGNVLGTKGTRIVSWLALLALVFHILLNSPLILKTQFLLWQIVCLMSAVIMPHLVKVGVSDVFQQLIPTTISFEKRH